MAESREYFLRWWIGHDAGDESVLLGDFTFTHSPDTTYALLVPALHLFEKLYSDRLSLSDPFSTTYYSVFDLIRDDPSVMARFREYTISGNVVTDSAMDASAYQKHLLALLDALTDQQTYVLVGGASLDGTTLMSSDLKAKASIIADSGTGGVAPPNPVPFKELLQCLIDQSLIRCMTLKHLYMSEKDGVKFDCDDFNLALTAFLHRRFAELGQASPDLRWYSKGIFWTCPELNADGSVKRDALGNVIRKQHSHAIGIVKVIGPPAQPGQPARQTCEPGPNGETDRYFLFDAQTGKCVEIGCACAQNEDCIAKKAMELLLDGAGYGTCPQTRELSPAVSFPPDTSGQPGFVPWWKCKSRLPNDVACPDDIEKNMWLRFSRILSECCGQGNVNPCSPALTPIPSQGTNGPDCHPEWYIWN